MSMVLYIALEKSGFQLPFLKKQENQEPLPQEKKYPKDTEWAETKGRSSYGAPVLFRDEPDDEIIPDFTQHFDTTQDESNDSTDDTTIDHNQSIEQSNNQAEAHKTAQEKKQAEAPVQEKLDITSSITKTIENKQDSTSFETIRQASNFAKASLDTSLDRSSDKQGEQKENKPENKQPQNNPLPAKTVQKTVTTIPSRVGKPIEMTKQIPSLAQLTQGVLNYVKDEGQYAVSMVGKKGGVPSDEQMKYERFLQKLGHCLQTAFSINNDKFPQCDPSVSSIEIFLALNKDGTLHNLRLVKTSGDPRVDAFMMFAFRDASSSFPTVPHYLLHNPFSITYVIDISPTRSNMGIYRR